MSPPAGARSGSEDISLLWASPERVEEITALHARLFNPPWDEQSISKLIEHPAAAALVAQVRDPKEMVGFVIGQLAADEAEILSIGVAPEWQRHGIARTMVEGLVRAARRAEVNRVFLEVSEDNEAALGLYKALDFSSVGRRKGYYARPGGNRVDAVILALSL